MLNLSKSEFDPILLEKKKNLEIQRRNTNIATELLIVANIGIYYKDILNGFADNYPSSLSVSKRLNGADGAKIKTKGLVEKYKEDYPEHFINGVWQSAYLPNYICYLGKKLTDKEEAGRKASEYKNAFLDKEYFKQFVILSGIKILEEQLPYGLNSKAATATMEINKNNKELLEKIGKIIGRFNKYGECDTTFLKEIVRGQLESIVKDTNLRIKYYAEEMNILRNYESDYLKVLEEQRLLILE